MSCLRLEASGGRTGVSIHDRYAGILFLCADEIADIRPLAGKHFIVEILLPVDIGNAVLQFF